MPLQDTAARFCNFLNINFHFENQENRGRQKKTAPESHAMHRHTPN